ncbi:MAG: mechanosensitive ion channel family protein [Prochloraceae cyanobacterium]|nr:mechanosensitive ion channel family protein [Prochloraceae cyanobacterium]
MRQICKYLKRSLLILLLLTIFILPSSAESNQKAGVFLDGREVIQVSSSGSITAIRRADRIETILQQEISTWDSVRSALRISKQENQQQDIEVRVRLINQVPVIYINDRYLVTVTQKDVIGENSLLQQAEIWQTKISDSLKKAALERSRNFLRQAVIKTILALLLAIGFHFALGKFWRHSLEEKKDEEVFLKARLLLARIALWLALIIYITDTYPQSRQWLYTITDESIGSLIFPLLFIVFSLIFGQYTPSLLRLSIARFVPDRKEKIDENFIKPVRGLLIISSTLVLISFTLIAIREYTFIYELLRFFIDLATIGSVSWLSSRLFRQFVRIYGIELIRKLGREVDELLLVFETLANTIIGIVAISTFARDRFDLIGLFAGLGIGGLAIVFAAQQTLQQLLGTVVLYLDRPFIPGEYIRLPGGLFGRVESIGLRSTKIRTAAKGTLVIYPNSTMANLEVENVTRGKKVMVLLYLDFAKPLDKQAQALVQETIKQSTDTLFGIDPGSTKITLFEPEDKPGTRARVTFFILGSSENSLELRKRLLEIANEKISKQFKERSISFTMQEPTIYVESPVTI